MKYVITWTQRAGGSAADNEASADRFHDLVTQWTPASGTTVHQFVVRIDGNGGFAVLESDNAADIASTLFKFTPHADYTVYPVLDFDEGVRHSAAAREFRHSVR
jgi:hypothetical protein